MSDELPVYGPAPQSTHWRNCCLTRKVLYCVMARRRNVREIITSESLYLSEAEALQFWSYVRPIESGCWEWAGSRNYQGYGQIHWLGGAIRAHRLSYALLHGVIPRDLVVMHTCDNPPCVNPSHLKLGTYADNCRDSVEKARWKGDVPATEWECARGHRRESSWKKCYQCKMITTQEGYRARRKPTTTTRPCRGLRGVRFDGRKSGKQFRAYLTLNGREHSAGMHATAEEAALAHDSLASRLLGDKAVLNYPNCQSVA